MKTLRILAICCALAAAPVAASEWQVEGADYTFHFRDAPHNYTVYAPYGSDDGRLVGRMVVGGCPDCSAVITGFWAEQDSSVACTTARDNSGHWGLMRFEFNADFTAFTGNWDYCGDGSRHPWNGYRTR